MKQVSPVGPVYQAGTLSGNPLAMAAGLAMLDGIDADPQLYNRLEQLGQRLETGVQAAITDLGLTEKLRFQRVGSMFCLYFTKGPVRSWDEASGADAERFSKWFHGMYERGFSLAPSGFEAGFLCSAHTEADMDAFAAACRESLAAAYPEGNR